VDSIHFIITPEESFEDSGKIQVPDPEMVDETENKALAEDGHDEKEESGETMIEGAWADILGSGNLKKKVL